MYNFALFYGKLSICLLEILAIKAEADELETGGEHGREGRVISELNLPPPPLVAGPLKKEFFCGFPYDIM